MSGRILTKAALLALKNDDFKSFVHETKGRRNPKRGDKHFDSTTKDQSANDSSIDLQRARKDVINLGLSGFSDKLEKEEAEIQLAIKLGAKPPKRQYKNYKEILEEKKQVKRVNLVTSEKIAKKFQFGSTQSFQKYLTGNRHKTKKNPKNVLESYGKVKSKKETSIKRNRK